MALENAIHTLTCSPPTHPLQGYGEDEEDDEEDDEEVRS